MTADGTFVLTTGRTGSTFLARLLHTHPEIVVVSDLLEPALDEIYFDPDVLLDGAAFWEVLTRPSLLERIDYWRERPTDELLFLPAADRDVSLLMTYTLPFLDDDPWKLRSELEPAIRDRPRLPAPEHFAFLLNHLRDRFGGSTWVERTGGSLPHAASIVAQFPDAKYVSLQRDPVETALSMRSGSFFRLYLAMAAGDARGWRRAKYADPAALAAMIERWTVDAEPTMAAIPPRQLHRLTYERLTTEPAHALGDLLRFVLDRELSPTDVAWVTDQSGLAVPPPGRAGELTSTGLARLRAACPEAIRCWERLRSGGR